MPRIVEFKHISDSRGELCVIEDELDFSIKRIFYIFNVKKDMVRGRHSHLKTYMGLVPLSGQCLVKVMDQNNCEYSYKLSRPDQCLILRPEEWREITNFDPTTTLLVLASEKYDPADYRFE